MLSKNGKCIVLMISCALIAAVCLSLFFSSSNAATQHTLVSVCEKNATVSEDGRNVIININSQYFADPCPRILFYQANYCNYHGLTVDTIVDSIYQACLIGNVEWYIDAANARGSTDRNAANNLTYYYSIANTPFTRTNTSPRMINVVCFDYLESRDSIRTKVVASLYKNKLDTGYHTITMDCIDRLLARWNISNDPENPYYDYLIFLYDGMVSSGDLSSANFFYPTIKTTNRVFPVSDNDLLLMRQYAEKLAKIPTFHMTPHILNYSDSSWDAYRETAGFLDYVNNGGPMMDEGMYLVRASYFDYKTNPQRITYRSYEEARNYYFPQDNIDYTTIWPGGTNSAANLSVSDTRNPINLYYTCHLMLHSLAFISPSNYLALTDEAGKFNFVSDDDVPTVEEFVSYMPAYHPYGNMDNVGSAISSFIQVQNIQFIDTLADGLSIPTDAEGNVDTSRVFICQYTGDMTGDYSEGWTDEDSDFYYSDYESSGTWVPISDDADFTYDAQTGTITATLYCNDTNYYGQKLRLVIIADADSDFGRDGTPINTNIDMSVTNYVSDGTILHHQEDDSPEVDFTIYKVFYNLGDYGSLNPGITLNTDSDDRQYEPVKYNYSPDMVDTTDFGTEENRTIITTPNYNLIGFVADSDVVLKNSGDTITSGTILTPDKINEIVVTSDITLTAVYGLHVTYVPDSVSQFNSTNVTDEGTIVELVNTDSNPLFTEASTLALKTGYELYTRAGYVADIDVTLNNDEVITAGTIIDEDTIRQIKVTSPIVFTAVHTAPLTATYKPGDHGFFSGNEESVSETLPSGSNLTYGRVESTLPLLSAYDNYSLTGFVADKDVTLEDSTVITAGTLIPKDKVQLIVITEDLELTGEYQFKLVVPTGVNINTKLMTVMVVGIIGLGSTIVSISSKKKRRIASNRSRTKFQ